MGRGTGKYDVPVSHIADTAFLSALYRVAESERPDALFKDPQAKILAAPRAKELTDRIAYEETRWLMAIRTAIVDHLIIDLVQSQQVDTIVNVACGLDTRPYRLNLPKRLRWIEADLPGIIDYKTETLVNERPTCQLDRIALDLTETSARKQLWSYFGRDSKHTILLTEGLLYYLSEETVTAMAEEFHAQDAIEWWIADLLPESAIAWMLKQLKRDMSPPGQVAIRFAPEEGYRFFETLGWLPLQFETFGEASEVLGRDLPDSLQVPEASGITDDSGVVLLQK